MSLDIGVGLYAMQSTAGAPAAWPTLYDELREDARLAEGLGLHSLWIQEHRFWYDGWCPSALSGASVALGATTTLRVGTGITVLPLLDPARLAVAGREAFEMSEGRLEVGVGLGYRVDEYDGLGVARPLAAKRMVRGLDEITAAWVGSGPSIWVGGIGEQSIRRATNRGLDLILPQTLRNAELEALIVGARQRAPATRVAVIRYVWITDGSDAARREAEERIVSSAREYVGAWWPTKDGNAFSQPASLERQMRRNLDTALIGTPSEVAAQARELEQIGVDVLIAQVATDRTRPHHRDVMGGLADAILQLRAVTT